MERDWRNPERVAPWKPRQKFRVSPAGLEAARRYREAMDGAQKAGDPRAALERAKQDWAAEHTLRAPDGILLEEFANGRETLAELQETMDALGLSLREARGTLDRLVAARFLEPLEPAAPTLPPSFRGRF